MGRVLRDSAVWSNVLLTSRRHQNIWGTNQAELDLYAGQTGLLSLQNQWQLLDLHQRLSQPEVNNVKNKYFGLCVKHTNIQGCLH